MHRVTVARSCSLGCARSRRCSVVISSSRRFVVGVSAFPCRRTVSSVAASSAPLGTALFPPKLSEVTILATTTAIALWVPRWGWPICPSCAVNLLPMLLPYFWRLEYLSTLVTLGVLAFGGDLVAPTVLAFDLCLGTKLVRGMVFSMFAWVAVIVCSHY